MFKLLFESVSLRFFGVVLVLKFVIGVFIIVICRVLLLLFVVLFMVWIIL